MKNQIVFLFLSLFAFSCSDDTQVTLQEKVLGEWQINSFVMNSCPDASENIPLTTANGEGCLDVMGDRTCMSIHIFENGIAEIRDGEIGEMESVETLTYELDEDNNTINLCQGLEDCETFSLRDDGLYNDIDENGCICTFGFVRM